MNIFFDSDDKEKNRSISLLVSSRSVDDSLNKSPRGKQLFSSFRKNVLETNVEKEDTVSTADEMDDKSLLSDLSSRKEDYGQIQLTIMYDKNKSKLIIKVIQAKNLSSNDSTSPITSFDSFVRIMLLPDRRKRTKRKTKTIKDSVAPQWDEQFDFELSLEESKTKSIDVLIKNTKSRFSRDKSFMGQCVVQIGSIDSLETGYTEWFQLHNQTFCAGMLKKLLD